MDQNNLTKVLKNLVAQLAGGEDVDLLRQLVEELKTTLQQIGETDKAVVNQILSEIESEDENPLFREVGMLLRRFHDQVTIINDEIPKNLGKLNSDDVAEMSGRLQQIITMTDKAANTTMDLAEEIMEDLTQQNDSTAPLITSLNSLINQDGIPESSKKIASDTIDQLENISNKNDSIQTKLTNILMAQDYQDLTGQVIHKVMNLLNTLQDDLAELIKRFGQVYQEAEEVDQIALEGPLSEDDENKSSQDDVDSLLKEFGF